MFTFFTTLNCSILLKPLIKSFNEQTIVKWINQNFRSLHVQFRLKTGTKSIEIELKKKIVN